MTSSYCKSQEHRRGVSIGETYLQAVSSLWLPISSSSDGCLLALRDDEGELWAELAREVVREASLDIAFRETVLPLESAWRRRSCIVGYGASAREVNSNLEKGGSRLCASRNRISEKKEKRGKKGDPFELLRAV